MFTDGLVVGLTANEHFGAHVSDLAQSAINGEGDPETGAQGEHQFDAVAVDGTQGGQRGVVHDPHVSAGRLAQLGLELETLPLGFELRVDLGGDSPGSREVARAHDVTIDELAGKADAHARTGATFDPFVQRFDETFG